MAITVTCFILGSLVQMPKPKRAMALPVSHVYVQLSPIMGFAQGHLDPKLFNTPALVEEVRFAPVPRDNQIWPFGQVKSDLALAQAPLRLSLWLNETCAMAVSSPQFYFA